MKLRAVPAAAGLASRGSRTILQRQAAAFKPSIQNQIARSSFKRAYASTASPAPVNKAPKNRFRYVKYAWRGTYTLAILGTVWLAYSIYETRFPKEQTEPDPTKKTLVILGKNPILPRKGNSSHSFNIFGNFRIWMGKRCPSQEVGYRKLQCHRHFTT